MVMDRATAWLRQATSDLAQAQDSHAAGRYEWACYAASQAGEKALKAGLIALGAEAIWGHNLAALLDRLNREAGLAKDPALLDDARILTQFNTLARYPVGDEAVAPTDSMTRSQAEGAIAAAERMLTMVTRDVCSAPPL
ncbi:HEPN domain-containing protein [Azospirillum sp. RWY-5-1]|uniref:HEPN domain-containing protein n=1 Tax=Azospirillum oleiclasticum TaxID=2735135 RepID=A0ABX2TGM9_9PROT|nr:HEPN domain-containing protein [Azospirillum oleiclasticum]NYZ16014.1 HEPN domain-containing protein [Azospirillum oleiclasticum]NYZ23507.1 HEPN domain-containing protein [Azospirillum oleiclasticum]